MADQAGPLRSAGGLAHALARPPRSATRLARRLRTPGGIDARRLDWLDLG